MPKKAIWLLFFLLFLPKKALAQTSTTYYFSPTFEKTDGVVTKYYALPGGAMAVRKNGELSYLHQDHLGSTRLITDNSGLVTEEHDYYPYGSPRLTELTQLTGLTDHLYTSQILDSSTDLYFYNARQYNPLTGAFISADVAQGPNRYAYVSGNPINRVDPSGLQDWTLDQLGETIWNYGGEVEGYDVMGAGDDELMWRAGRVYAGRALFWERHEEQLKNNLALQMELTFLSQAMAGEDLGKIMIASAGQAATRAALTMGPTILNYLQEISFNEDSYWKTQYSESVKAVRDSGVKVVESPAKAGNKSGGTYITGENGKLGYIDIHQTGSYRERLVALEHEYGHHFQREWTNFAPLTPSQVFNEEYYNYSRTANSPYAPNNMIETGKSMVGRMDTVMSWELPLETRCNMAVDLVGATGVK